MDIEKYVGKKRQSKENNMTLKMNKFRTVLKGIGLATILITMTGCQQMAARNLGGKATIELKENQKLQEVTWKDDNLWILVRERHEDEFPETYTFYEESDLNVLEGKVTLIEK